jgi:hypothetical protein
MIFPVYPRTATPASWAARAVRQSPDADPLARENPRQIHLQATENLTIQRGRSAASDLYEMSWSCNLAA